jgi:predicted RecB family nuclease
MKLHQGRPVYSATDLSNFLACEHLTALDRLALRDADLRGRKVAPDEGTQLIQQKGVDHEKAYLARLQAEGRQVIDIAQTGDPAAAVERTHAAMRDGVEVIYQAALEHGNLAGYADFLIRVAPATPGTPAQYEAADTKLARTPQAKFLVQLAFYSRLLEKAQGQLPEHIHVVLGDQTQRSYRSVDVVHYFDALLARYQGEVARLEAGGTPAYPHPRAHCDMCSWRAVCEQRRQSDDHLSLVANIARPQIDKLEAAGIHRLAQLAQLPDTQAIPQMATETLERLRGQARLQHQARTTSQRVHELLPVVPESGRGFLRMPAPDAGDLFFDMEGNPLEAGGLEYLFGVWFRDGADWAFKGFWAHDRQQERQAFEDFMDFVTARRKQYSNAHIYHYASYEESALKRLACAHATRVQEVDDLLRQGALVDLYKVVREALRISEPNYSIKSVERFYRPQRSGDVQNAGASIVYYQRWRETQDPQWLDAIESYNRDDVESTWQLHQWLLQLRPAELPWRLPTTQTQEPEPQQDIAEAGNSTRRSAQQVEQRLARYQQQMVAPLPEDRKAWQPEHKLTELVFLLLDFHRRANKPQHWAFYARRDMDLAQLLDDTECLAGLTQDPDCPPYPDRQSIVYSYRVPPQETKLAAGDRCTRCDTGQGVGALSYDPTTGRASLRIGAKKDAPPPHLSIGPERPTDPQSIIDSLFRFADSFIERDGQYPAVEAFLRRETPVLQGRAPGQPLVAPGQDITAGAVAAACSLDQSYLYVQGPPGAGKTYTGARMIAAILSQGRRVGILSNSHKAINLLMAAAMVHARAMGLTPRAVKKITPGSPDSYMSPIDSDVRDVSKNSDVMRVDPLLIGGTAWLFADPALAGQIDTLFVEEAGQVSLTNLVGAATCARNIVLLGDQMQLPQPIQGVHPGRSGESALDYLLDGASTIAAHQGIFLPTSWRMHPAVCSFISEAVYEGRLLPAPSNVARTLVLDAQAHPLLRPAGLAHAPIAHTGCSQSSEAEANLILELYRSALTQRYTDRDGQTHAMQPANILVVAPYNAQVNLLRRVLPDGAQVGTVDKFQGQEAELVLVSMTTSSGNDLPRNIEFLYSKNRLNVAISRAKCLSVVVANPQLFSVGCSTPEEVVLVNLLCWAGAVGQR